MKFRSVINETAKMKELLNIVSTLSKLDEKFIVIVRPQSLTFLLPSDHIESRPIYWFDINSQEFFQEYSMQGVGTEGSDNKIYFEVSANNMYTALTHLKNAVTLVKIKLINNSFPCLSINLSINSLESDEIVDVLNEVPVVVIPRSQWKALKTPSHIVFDIICTKLPRFKILKKYIDTYKNISNKVNFYFTKNGELSLITETDESAVASHFKNLQVLHYERNNTSSSLLGSYDGEDVSIFVDTKKISTLLSCIQYQEPVQLNCCVKSKLLLKIFFEIRNEIVGNCLMSGIFDNESENDEEN